MSSIILSFVKAVEMTDSLMPSSATETKHAWATASEKVLLLLHPLMKKIFPQIFSYKPFAHFAMQFAYLCKQIFPILKSGRLGQFFDDNKRCQMSLINEKSAR
jgi:hypothetical protein